MGATLSTFLEPIKQQLESFQKELATEHAAKRAKVAEDFAPIQADVQRREENLTEQLERRKKMLRSFGVDVERPGQPQEQPQEQHEEEQPPAEEPQQPQQQPQQMPQMPQPAAGASMRPSPAAAATGTKKRTASEAFTPSGSPSNDAASHAGSAAATTVESARSSPDSRDGADGFAPPPPQPPQPQQQQQQQAFSMKEGGLLSKAAGVQLQMQQQQQPVMILRRDFSTRCTCPNILDRRFSLPSICFCHPTTGRSSSRSSSSRRSRSSRRKRRRRSSRRRRRGARRAGRRERTSRRTEQQERRA